MAVRACPAALAFAAFLSDLTGEHGFARSALLLAIPAAFALVLDRFAHAVEARCGLTRAVAAATGLLLVLFSAALRSPAVVGGVPRIAVSALAVAVATCGAAGIPLPRARPQRLPVSHPRDEGARLVDAA